MKKIKQDIFENLKKQNTKPYINFLSNNPNFKIYKYRSGNDRNIDSLRNNKLWMACSTTMDDECDCGFLTIENLDLLYENLCKLNTKFVEEKYSSLIKEGGKFLQKDTFILCFGESSNNEDLWCKYADNHKGFCVEYAIKDFLKFGLLPFPVVYSNREISITNFANQSKCNNIFDIILQKNEKEWSQQDEWRIFNWRHNLKLNSTDTGCLISVPHPTAIFYGNNINKKTLFELKQIANNLNIPLIKEA